MARFEKCRKTLKSLKISAIEIVGIVIYFLVFSAFLSMVLFFVSSFLDMVMLHV